MIRSSSRKVKPTSKFVEFELASANGKKRGRPRKSIDGRSHDETDPILGQNYSDQSMTPVEPLQSQSMTQLSVKEELLAPQEQQNNVDQQGQVDQSQQPHQLPSATPKHLGRPKREPKTPATPNFSAVSRVDTNNQADKTQSHQQQTSSTPLREPKTPKPLSSRKEELMRLRDENITFKAKFDQITADYEELKRQTSYTGLTVPKIDYDDLKERYQRDITYAKRHEWCVVCLTQSKYYCCWNTTYCSQKCQVADWYARHGKSCERRRSILKSIH